MTNILAIANRYSIILKVDPSFFEATRIAGSNFYRNPTHVQIVAGNKFRNMDAFGVCYYTTNVNNKTYIPLSSNLIEYVNDSWSFNTNVIDNNITIGYRNNSNNILFFLVEGLTPNTTYHISAYYSISGSITTLGFSTVTTKPERSSFLTFNDIVLNSSTSGHEALALKTKNELEVCLPIVAKIYNDCTNIVANYTPTIKYDASGWAANSSMDFNCRSNDDNLRSTTIHELAHNHFKPYITDNQGFCSRENAIKFMEFATGYEGATWGRITNHYYPIISSARYIYIDDYLVAMATDVDYLFGN